MQKSFVDALNRYEKQEEEKKCVFFQEMAQKKYSSSLSRQSSEIYITEIKSKIDLQINFKVRHHCFVSNITRPINKMFMTLIYLKNSQSQKNC